MGKWEKGLKDPVECNQVAGQHTFLTVLDYQSVPSY